MSDLHHFEPASVKQASDVDTWHPDLETLVRYDLPFVCFDGEGLPVHISRGAALLLARHRHVKTIFEALRGTACELLTSEDAAASRPVPRVGARVSDPDGSFWSMHVVRTRHDWLLAVAVSDGVRTVQADSRLRDRLTGRELEVASLLADGARTKSVAAALSISVHTARHHTEQVFRKLGVHSRVELTRMVLRGGDIFMHAAGRA